MGRKKLPDAKRKAASVGVRMTAAEKKKLQRHAKMYGWESLSPWLLALGLREIGKADCLRFTERSG